MAKEITAYEAQLEAMGTVMKALVALPKEAQGSVLDWVSAQLGHSIQPIQHTTSAPTQPQHVHTEKLPGAGGAKRQGTVSGIAQKLGANSCRTLLEAATAYLTINQSKESFSREELIACAKEARGWKAEYSNQMATAIGRMIEAETLFEKSRDVFSVPDELIKEWESKLA